MIFRVAQLNHINNRMQADNFIYIFEPFLIEAINEEHVIAILKSDFMVRDYIKSGRKLHFYIEECPAMKRVTL
nr:hypothetical protein CKG001_17670 [Bdellovibrio sp. CKG001]